VEKSELARFREDTGWQYWEGGEYYYCVEEDERDE
jgi:hypothetical protein